MATSRSSSAAARLSRTAAAALRSSGTGYQSIRSDLAAAIVRPPPSLIAANEGKISSASFSSSFLNRIASSSALARSYSASAATGQISGAKPARKGKSALTAVVVNLPNRTLWHIYEGIEEIMADYVHHEMTRNWILISFKLFLIIVMKDLFLSLADL